MLSTTPAADPRLEAPAIGGLLRLAWRAHRERMYERVTASGYEDVTRAQFELVRWPSIDGLRPGEIAQLAGLSKQTVNDLLGELERAGYVERHPAPEDGRARIVRLTERGRALQRSAHEISLALERVWATTLGEERFALVREALEEVVATGLPAEDELPASPGTRGPDAG